MVDLEEVVDPKPIDSAGGNRPPKGEGSIDTKPSKNVVQVIESLKKGAEFKPKKKVAAKKNSKRPSKKKVPLKRKAAPKKATKRAAPKKTTPSKKKVTKKKSGPPTRKIPIVPEAQEIPKRRLIPTSLTNLVLFTIIFSVLVAAQITIMHIERQQKIPLRVAPIQITAEEPVDGFEVPESGSGEVSAEGGPASGWDDDKDVVVGEPEKIGEAKEDVTEGQGEKVSTVIDEVTDIEPEAEEDVIEAEEEKVAEVPVKKKVVAKKTRRSKSTYYRPDPYTNSSSLDLDGAAAREQYRAGNVVLVPVAPGTSSKKVKKTNQPVKSTSYSSRSKTEPVERSYDTIEVKNLHERSYSDTRNPWNSGGSMDLDNSSNRSKYSKETAKRRR